MRYPPPLRPGTTIGICAPSSGVQVPFTDKLDKAEDNLEKMGYRILETPSVRSSHQHVSADGHTRAEEFMDLFTNPKVKAIIPPWGGEFLCDMLPCLDMDAIRSMPGKWIMGYSDISTLLFFLTINGNLASAHGPNFLDFGMDTMDPSVLRALGILGSKKEDSVVQESLEQYQAEWPELEAGVFSGYRLTHPVVWKTLSGESQLKFSGRLIGGCLDVLCKLAGTPFALVPQWLDRYRDDGIVWLWESCEMQPPDIYRTLWQLRHAGWFQYCSGMVVGRPAGIAQETDFSFTDALSKALSDLPFPVIYDADLGHLPPQLTYILGARATISFNSGSGRVFQELS